MNYNGPPNHHTQMPSQELVGAVEEAVPRPKAYEGRAGIEVRPDGAEFHLGNTTYHYLGKTNDDFMEFSSIADDGVKRSFLVYTSRSEGSPRVSQGGEIYEEDGELHTRLMKGPELSARQQYTQDTQLHPGFADKVSVLQEIRELRQLPIRPTPIYESEEAERLLKDFDRQTETYLFGSKELDDQLRELPAGRQSVTDIKRITGFDPSSQPDDAATAILDKIDDLNNTLQTSGAMPDFSQPPNVMETTRHPILGNIIRETFEKSVNGVVYEWQMARDQNGRVWIDRIRFAKAEPTAYGTDRQMVYSGLLTSKPVDYKHQSDGLPTNLRQDMGNGDNDVSAFLKKLAPVQEYSKYCYSRDQNYIFASEAA